jgi:predicted metal-dependent hydrolase
LIRIIRFAVYAPPSRRCERGPIDSNYSFSILNTNNESFPPLVGAGYEPAPTMYVTFVNFVVIGFPNPVFPDKILKSKFMVDKYTLNLGGTPIIYDVKVSKRSRRLRITVTTAGVSVTLPEGIRVAEAEKFLRANGQWVLAQLERSKKHTPRSALPQDVILFHGVPAKIQRVEEAGRKLRAKIEHVNGKLIVHVPAGSPKPSYEIVEDYLRGAARQEIEAAVTLHAAQMRVHPKSVSIRDQRTRWGSCSTRGTLSFNWRLIMAPPAVMEYVVIHELAHLFEPNHSRDFWAVVQKFAPAFKQSRLWLRKNASALRTRH